MNYKKVLEELEEYINSEIMNSEDISFEELSLRDGDERFIKQEYYNKGIIDTLYNFKTVLEEIELDYEFDEEES